MDKLVELRELLAKATAGPWELQDSCSWRRIGTREGNGNVLCPDTYSREDRHPDLTAGRGEDVYANLRLIVAAVNALPTLLDRIEALEARIEAVRRVVDFGYQHCVDGRPVNPLKNGERCSHGRLEAEDCIGCYDEALLAALDPASARKAHTEGGGEP